MFPRRANETGPDSLVAYLSGIRENRRSGDTGTDWGELVLGERARSSKFDCHSRSDRLDERTSRCDGPTTQRRLSRIRGMIKSVDARRRLARRRTIKRTPRLVAAWHERPTGVCRNLNPSGNAMRRVARARFPQFYLVTKSKLFVAPKMRIIAKKQTTARCSCSLHVKSFLITITST